MSNPFFYGSPVPADDFLGRRREIRHIAGRVANQGQSIAIVGEPRNGKTSLLNYLSSPAVRNQLYGKTASQLLFSFIDMDMLGYECDQAQFWEQATRPLVEQVCASEPDSSLTQAYSTCQENAFGTFTLERLLARMKEAGWCLVILLDEFDRVLHHPILNKAEFFGSLRSLATRSRGALALIVASRQSLTTLNEATQQFSRLGSPYFNFFSEITLGALPNTAVTHLLDRAKDRFTPHDRGFITSAAGGHPYLVQAAASALWEAYDEGISSAVQRWQEAGERLYDEAALTLGNTWQHWPSATRQAFSAVALAQIPDLLGHREFLVGQFIRDLHDLGPELRDLRKRGFVIQQESESSGYRIRPGAFLWWMADELTRTVRDDDAFEEWLQAEVLEGPLTRNERQELTRLAQGLMGMLRGGATALIEASAKGLGAALTAKS
jgi:hypothetical protein